MMFDILPRKEGERKESKEKKQGRRKEERRKAGIKKRVRGEGGEEELGKWTRSLSGTILERFKMKHCKTMK